MSGAQSPWYEQFFTGLVLEFWRRVIPRDLTMLEAEFLERVLEVKPPAALLDIPCGNGRHALELAARGFRVTGIDISEEFVAEARGAAAEAPSARCEFVQADMRHLSRLEEFDGAYCFGNSFGYLDHDDTMDFLQRLARALRPGARAVFDVGTVAEVLLPDFHERLEMSAGDLTMIAVNHYDAARSRLLTDLEFHKGPRTETRSMTQHVYAAGELRRMAELSGLAYVAAYGSAAGDEFQLGAPRFLLVTERLG